MEIIYALIFYNTMWIMLSSLIVDYFTWLQILSGKQIALGEFYNMTEYTLCILRKQDHLMGLSDTGIFLWGIFMGSSCTFSTFSQEPVGDPQVGTGWGEDAPSLKPPCPLFGACHQTWSEKNTKTGRNIYGQRPVFQKLDYWYICSKGS